MATERPRSKGPSLPGFGLLVAAGAFIVLAGILVLGWFLFIPKFGDGFIHETWALERLRDLAARQSRVQAGGTIDADGDRIGEFAPLGSLGLPGITARGVDARSHYVFRVFLPDGDGTERHWCAYAWPEHYGAGATTAFFVDSSGAIVRLPNSSKYSGPDRGPDWNSALPPGGGWGTPPRADGPATDGKTWIPLR